MSWANFSDLVGKTLTKIVGDEFDECLEFHCTDGTIFYMYHDQDCCESVSIEDINGDRDAVIGYPILEAFESSSGGNPKDSLTESCTWTFYRMATVKGYLNIRWYGSSNGYYSERVTFRSNK